MAWDVLVGELKIGRLTGPRPEAGSIHCVFEAGEVYDRYAEALSSAEIWERDDDELDAVIDEIAVEGLFLVADDGSVIVDPALRIDGADAWFPDQSS